MCIEMVQTIDTNVLVVDDDRSVLKAAQLLLKHHFRQVDVLDRPAELPQRLGQQEFDVVLLDMNFAAGATTGEEGLHWLGVVRKLAPATKLVLMTAYGGVDAAVNAMRHGASDFVVKPWDNARLIATVSAAARLAQADRELHRLKARQQVLEGDADQYHIIGQ